MTQSSKFKSLYAFSEIGVPQPTVKQQICAEKQQENENLLPRQTADNYISGIDDDNHQKNYTIRQQN
jgi:hypothetical protein